MAAVSAMTAERTFVPLQTASQDMGGPPMGGQSMGSPPIGGGATPPRTFVPGYSSNIPPTSPNSNNSFQSPSQNNYPPPQQFQLPQMSKDRSLNKPPQGFYDESTQFDLPANNDLPPAPDYADTYMPEDDLPPPPPQVCILFYLFAYCNFFSLVG